MWDKGWKQMQSSEDTHMAEGCGNWGPAVPAVRMGPPVSQMRETTERRRDCPQSVDRP